MNTTTKNYNITVRGFDASKDWSTDEEMTIIELRPNDFQCNVISLTEASARELLAALQARFSN